jgi:hypothetical protein
MKNASVTGRRWDTSTSSVWFNAVETEGEGDAARTITVQYWFDDAESLGLK